MKSSADRSPAPAQRRRPKWLWLSLRLLLMIGVLAYLGWVNRDNLRKLIEERPRWGYLVLAAILFLLVIFVAVNRWYMLLRAGNVRAPWRWAMRCGFIGAFFNSFVPGGVGGDAARLALVYRGLEGQRSQAAVSIVLDRVVGLGGLFLLASVAALMDWRRFAPPGKLFPVAAFVFVMSGATIAGLALVFLVRDSKRWPEFDTRRLVWRLLGAVAAYRHKVGWLALGVLISVVVQLGCCTALYCCVMANPFEERLTFGLTLVLGAISNLVNTLPLTPGGIGLGEGAFQELAAQAGYASGFTAYLLFRLAMTAVNLVGALFWLGGASGRKNWPRGEPWDLTRKGTTVDN